MQDARGASLIGDPGTSPGNPTDEAAAAPTPRPRRRLALFVVVAALALALDVVTKIVVVSRLTDHPPVNVLGSLLRLDLARNPGAAFSTGTRYTVVISLVAITAAIVVSWLGHRTRSRLWALALGLLLGGILGNLGDRIFREPGPLRGHVVDFLQLPHWPVFNVADMCINVAALLILVQAVRGIRLDGHRTADDAR